MTYWQSPLLFCGLFDFFALWLASDVNYNLMTFGDTLRDGSCFGKLVSSMEHFPLKFMMFKHLSFTFSGNVLTFVLHQYSKLEAHISANICNISVVFRIKQTPYEWQ